MNRQQEYQAPQEEMLMQLQNEFNQQQNFNYDNPFRQQQQKKVPQHNFVNKKPSGKVAFGQTLPKDMLPPKKNNFRPASSQRAQQQWKSTLSKKLPQQVQRSMSPNVRMNQNMAETTPGFQTQRPRQAWKQQQDDYNHKLYDEMDPQQRSIVNLGIQPSQMFQQSQGSFQDSLKKSFQETMSEKQIENKVFEFLNNIYFNKKNEQVQQQQQPKQPDQDQLLNMLFQKQMIQPEIQTIKQTTDTLGHELKEMRKQIMEMQMHGSEKDAEIIKLNMHLTDEKKKIQEIMRSQKSLNRSMSNTPQRDDRNLQLQISQMQEENELLVQENKTLRKKNEQHKKQFQIEITNVQKLKKQIKMMEQKLENVPDEQLQGMKSQYTETIKKLKEEKSQLQTQNADLNQQVSTLTLEVQKALKIHKANEQLQKKVDQYKKDNQKQHNDQILLQQTIESYSDKINDLQKQIIFLESDNEKSQELRQLEKKMNQKSTGDLACQNCLSNYSKYEESQLKLKEAIRKIEKIQNQEPTIMDVGSDEKLVKENEQLKMRVEQLNEQIKTQFTNRLQSPPPKETVRLQSPPPVVTQDSNEKDQMIVELSQQIQNLKVRESELLKKIKQLESEIQDKGEAAGGADPEEIKKLMEQITQKDKVIEQVSMKMQTDAFKTMELHEQIGQLQSELANANKQKENINKQFQETKEAMESLMKGKKGKKK